MNPASTIALTYPEKGHNMRKTTTIQSAYHLVFRHLFSVYLTHLTACEVTV
jgi:hypothetical protein